MLDNYQFDIPYNYTLTLPEEFSFIYFTDFHFMSNPPEGRFDKYPNNLFDKLSFVLNHGKINGCSFVLFGGDFISSVSDENNLDEHRHQISGIINHYGLPIFSILGNHDFKGNLDQLMKSPISWYISRGDIKPFVSLVINDLVAFIGIPYLSNNPEVSSVLHRICEAILKTLESNYSKYMIFFIIHQLIENAYYVKYGVKWDYLSKFKAKGIFVGHEHLYKGLYTYKDNVIIQPGSLTRYHNSYDEHHKKPSFCKVDINVSLQTYKISFINVPVFPPEEVFYITSKQVKNDIDSFREETYNLAQTLFVNSVKDNQKTRLRNLIRSQASDEIFSFIEPYLVEEGL